MARPSSEAEAFPEGDAKHQRNHHVFGMRLWVIYLSVVTVVLYNRPVCFILWTKLNAARCACDYMNPDNCGVNTLSNRPNTSSARDSASVHKSYNATPCTHTYVEALDTTCAPILESRRSALGPSGTLGSFGDMESWSH